MEKIDKYVEVLVFASSKPITILDIVESIRNYRNETLSEELIEASLIRLQNKFQSDDFSFELVHRGGGYQFLTKPAYQDLIGAFLKLDSKRRLTRAAIETLSIIAYKQPVNRMEVDSIRGVNSEYTIHKLLEKELVEISGRDPGPGRPLIYKTTQKFLDYFGINNLSELPQLKDIRENVNQIGSSAPIDENNFAINN